MKPSARYKVDATMFSAVAICLVPGCGARYSAGSRNGALWLLADHIATAHKGWNNRARSWLNQCTRAA